MTRRQRFGVWVASVVVALAAPLWLHANVPSAPLLAAVTGLAALSVIFLLLATTPADAIKLHPWASSLAIGLGTLEVALLAGLPPLSALALAAFGLLTPILAGRRVLLTPRHSPWIYTLLLWHPVFWLSPTVRSAAPESSPTFWPAFFAIGICLILLTRSPAAAVPARLSALGSVAGWGTAGAIALWMARLAGP